MKKLLLVLLALPLIGFGQTAEDYFNKAGDYYENEQYQLAIDNVTEAITINPDYADAYYNRGFVYAHLENYTAAIADFTSAIKIDPDAADAYVNRGIAKEKSGQSYCSDYKKACDLGDNECCEWYYKQCR
jgi:tetratricopeptide (TPR) repeat protein